MERKKEEYISFLQTQIGKLTPIRERLDSIQNSFSMESGLFDDSESIISKMNYAVKAIINRVQHIIDKTEEIKEIIDANYDESMIIPEEMTSDKKSSNAQFIGAGAIGNMKMLTK